MTDAAPVLRPRRLARALWWGAGLFLLALVAIAITVAAVVGSERGQHWLLSQVPGLVVEAPAGPLWGGAFKARRVDVQAGARQITLHDVQWRNLQWQWRPYAGAWLAITLDAPKVARVDVGAAPPGPTPALKPPATLRLPVAIAVNDAQIGELLVAGAPPLQLVNATLALGEGQGALHRITRATAQTDTAQIALFGTIAAEAPFALTADAQLSALPTAATPWQGQVHVQGPLESLQAKVKLASSRTAEASVDATVQLTPFAAWPLGAMDLKLHQLNLASLDAKLPQTQLSGQASINTSARDAPIQARIELSNAKPGRWDAQALPIERLVVQAEGLASDRNRLLLPQFEAVLHQNAGTVRGSGQWRGHEAELKLQLSGLRPAALDARAAALTAAGSTTLAIVGLPSPEGKLPPEQTLDVKAVVDLQGQLDAPPRQPVRLQTKAHVVRDASKAPAQQWRVALNDLQLRSAGASAEGGLQASLLQNGKDSRWSLQSSGTLANFDPAAWWQSNTALPPALFNGRWRADLKREGAQTAGLAELTIADSRVGGVPTSGNLLMKSQGSGWAIDGNLQAADNTVKAQGLISADGSQDRLTAQIEAPTLAALTPLARNLPAAMLPAAAREHLPSAGSMSGRIELQGRWPQLRTAGELKLNNFQSARSQLKQAQAQWQAGPDAQAPLLIDVQAQALAVGNAKAESLSLRAEGTVAAHQLKFSADTSLKPPAALNTLAPELNAAAASGSRLVFTSEGRFDRATRRWQSTSQMNAASRAAGNAPWFAAQDVALAAQFDPKGRLAAVQASGGKSQLGGVQGAQLLWREARWTPDAGAIRGELKLDVELLPMAATPLLTRLYPQAGFGGDLAVKGRVAIQASEKFSADVVIERERGDLFVRDEGQTQAQAQALGLTDLRMGFVANEGTWHFTQAVAGANLGVLVGATSMRLPATARWPAPTSPMEGVLEWQVADMGIWARFMPPGWRLGGKLRTSAAIGGQFGAPEVRGQMEGQGLAIRNLLQGVDVRDGELALTLTGAQAKVERFVFKGGDGELRLTGGATLGATPSAKLTLMADKFRLIGRIDRRIVATGQAELALAADKLALNGKLTVDEGLIDLSRGDAPTLDSDVIVRRRTSADNKTTDEQPDSPESANAPTAARKPAGAPRDLNLALALDLGRDLKLRGRGLDTKLTGQLNITAPGGRMAVNGTVRAIDGTYAAYGQKLDIERGVLTFNGTVENPRLDIFAVRPNLDVRVGVQVAGTAQVPRVRLSSEPEMSEFEKLSWLVLGRAGDGLGRPDTALLQRAALALLSGPDADSSGSPLSALGLDDFSVRQTSEGDVRNTVVSLGKQLSRRWYLGYERGVNSTTGTWQLIYRAAQRFTLRAQSGEENALDAIWTWRWN
jgi:translocation and assembly module TamB